MEPEFCKTQHAFTRYLRDPEGVAPPPGLEADGLAVYANAVIANMEVFVGDNFPRVKAIMSETAWSALVRDYFREHQSTTPLFVELPGEFVDYLTDTRDVPEDPPFLLELAHFDLLENLVSSDEALIDEHSADRSGDLMRGVPVVNPTTQLVRYAFPVHKIDSEFRPDEIPAMPTFIVAFRDRGNRYGTIDLNPATARAVELLLGGNGLSGEDVMRLVAEELQHPDVDAVIAGGSEILNRLAERDVLLGTASNRRP